MDTAAVAARKRMRGEALVATRRARMPQAATAWVVCPDG
jgi:hypothetical protein